MVAPQAALVSEILDSTAQTKDIVFFSQKDDKCTWGKYKNKFCSIGPLERKWPQLSILVTNFE